MSGDGKTVVLTAEKESANAVVYSADPRDVFIRGQVCIMRTWLLQQYQGRIPQRIVVSFDDLSSAIRNGSRDWLRGS